MLRQMIRIKPQSGEEKGDYLREVNTKLHHPFEVFGIVQWDRVSQRSLFSRAGHVARMVIYCLDRLTYHVLLYKNASWIQMAAGHTMEIICMDAS